jgi:TolB-like protein
MPDTPMPSKVIRFGDFEEDLSALHLSKRGVKVGLRDQSFAVLAMLLEHPGEIVTREDLRRRLWPKDVFVNFESNLNTAVARLREVLGDSADHPRFVETVPKHGYRFVGDASKSLRPKPRLLVLPFANLSGDPAQEHFSDAITEDMITRLAGLAPERLAVIARTTAMHYKGSPKEVAQIGHELALDYVVEGSVRLLDDRITVNVQLIQVSDQTHLLNRISAASRRPRPSTSVPFRCANDCRVQTDWRRR